MPSDRFQINARSLRWLAAGGLLAAVVTGLFPLLVPAVADSWVYRGGPIIVLVGLGLTLPWLGKTWLSWRGRTIRARLLFGFVTVALLAAIGTNAGSVIVGYYSGQEQVMSRLQSVLTAKELKVQNWADSLQSQLLAALNEQYATERASIVLDLPGIQYYNYYLGAMRRRFQILADRSPYLTAVLLLNADGTVIVSTHPDQEGGHCLYQDFFQQGLTASYVRLPLPLTGVGTEVDLQESTVEPCLTSTLLRTGELAIASRPVTDLDGEVLGVIAGLASIKPVTEVLADQTGLGRTGNTYLLGFTEGALSAEERPRPTDSAPNPGAGTGSPSGSVGTNMESHRRQPGAYLNQRGVRVIGISRWSPGLRVLFVAEQNFSEAFEAIATTLRINLVLAAVAVLVAISASLLIARSISKPLGSLVETAIQIAGGDLTRAADVDRDDELGTLAVAFNSMTGQLRDLISNLEQRVRERTSALRRRALQLETSARVSRDISSILDIGTLLTQVAQLVRDRFDYYHASIYLLQAESGKLSLRASSGPISPQLQELEVDGQSLNGTVVQINQALLVDDVTQDARYRLDENLPDTRSELVVPLRLGDKVVGTLDVHSVELNAFDSDDILVLQSLAEQVAVAIENARLYERSRALAVLEERDRLARQLHDSVTQSLYGQVVFAGAGRKMIEGGDVKAAEQHLLRIEGAAQQALKEMRLLIYELRPAILKQEGLLGALGKRLDAVERRTGTKAHLLVKGEPALTLSQEESLYWIAQEALNNALKHAAAKSVTVRLNADGDLVTLDVVDDGRGFDPEAMEDTSGLGLTSMRERAQSLGGSLTIQSVPGGGTRVRFTLDLGTTQPSDGYAQAQP